MGGSIREYKKKNGKKSYTAYYDKVINGERIRNHKTFFAKVEAHQWLADMDYELKKGIVTKDSIRKRLVRDAIKEYIEKELPYKKNARNVKQHLSWWNEQIGKYEVGEIIPAHIAQCRDRLLNDPGRRGFKISNATVNRYLASISSLFGWLLKEKHWIQKNPVTDIRKPKVNNSRRRFLSDEELPRLLIACDESRNPYLGVIVRVALLTGMRRGEIMNLTWKDIDFEDKQIFLEETKNGDSRTISMVDKLEKVLKGLMGDVCYSINTLLFPGEEDPSKPRDIRSAWERALKVAEIEDFKFHDLRHSAASIMLEAGVSHMVIARILGHRVLNTTLRYSHLSDKGAREALAHISKKVEGVS